MANAIQVTETKNNGLAREFKVVVDASQIATQVDQRLEEVGKTAKMAGFRPGKIPMNVLRKRYGQSVIGEVLENMVRDTSRKVLEERKMRPALQPKINITTFDEKQSLEYVMEFELFPETPDVAFDKIKLQKWKAEAAEKDINEGLDRVRQAHKGFETAGDTKYAAKIDDAVLIDFVGKLDGKPFDGGSAEDFRLTLGSGQFIPGFEDQLVGVKTGDKKDVKVDFPENYHSADLAGKPAVFEVNVKDVLKQKLPELNDEFAKTVGFEGLDKLQAAVKDQIEKDYGNIARSRLKKELFDLLDKDYAFAVPATMVDMEFTSLWQQVEQERKTNPDMAKKSEEQLKADFTKMAERRVRLGILLAEIGRKNNLEVGQDEIRRAVYEQARMFPGQEQRVVEFYQKNPDSIEQLKGPILEEKVVDYVLEKISLSEKSVSSKELLDAFAELEKSVA